MILAGIFSSFGYLVLCLYEQKLLLAIPVEIKPKWIPRVRFQKGLGHLATISALGFSAMCFLIEKTGGKAGIFCLLISLYYFAEAYKHFKRAHLSMVKKELL